MAGKDKPKYHLETPFGKITVYQVGDKRPTGSSKIANPVLTDKRKENPVRQLRLASLTAIARLVKAYGVKSGKLIDGRLTPPSVLLPIYLQYVKRNIDKLAKIKVDKGKVEDKELVKFINDFYTSAMLDRTIFKGINTGYEGKGNEAKKKAWQDVVVVAVAFAKRVKAGIITAKQIVGHLAGAAPTGEAYLELAREIASGKVSAGMGGQQPVTVKAAPPVAETEQPKVIRVGHFQLDNNDEEGLF